MRQTSFRGTLLRTVFVAALTLGGGSAALAQGATANGAVIVNGATVLGVNNTGHLNFSDTGPGGQPLGPLGLFNPYNAFAWGIGRIGVFEPGGAITVGDATSPGCLCEGWGVAAIIGGTPVAGFASVDNSGIGGLTGGTFSATPNSATSTVNLTDAPITVRHAFGPSLAADTFQVNVTITNNGTEAAQNVIYRRAMDWDVPPTDFNEYVTHQGVVANLVANGGNVLFASNNGFADVNPLFGAGSIDVPNFPTTVNVDFVDAGIQDHGSVFDFAFGDLAPGESRNFNIFYGSAANEANALAALQLLNANVYSLGQSSIFDTPPDGGGDGDVPTLATSVGNATGEPATFFFAFGGIAGAEPGSSPTNPVLPFVIADPDTGAVTFTFDAPQPGRWYDPPFAVGFTYELVGGATFTEVGLPPITFGTGPYTLSIDGIAVTVLGPDDSYAFGPNVTKFEITGIGPLDTTDPNFATLFPTFLDWDGRADTLLMTSILASAAPPPTGVPEPASFALFGLGLAGLAAARRRRRALA